MNKTIEQKEASAAIQNREPNVVVKVGQQVRDFVEKGTLLLPADYSPQNALKAAWLRLQEVKDRDGKAALQVCSESSIYNALLDMIVQGLNPAKQQCYFIVYGTALTCQRSYFGDMAIVQERVMPGSRVYSNVVYKDDALELGFDHGRQVVRRHDASIDNVNAKEIIAAYAGIISKQGEDLGVVVMTWEQIQKSWSKSKTYKPGGATPHTEFPDQMALRTVIRRRVKPVINASTDAMLVDAVRRQDEANAEAEIDAEAEELANAEALEPSSAPALAASADSAEREQPAPLQEETAAEAPY